MLGLLALGFGGLCGAFALQGEYKIPFTQKEIKDNIHSRRVSEYNRYCKEAAGYGIYSREQLTFEGYQSVIAKGYTRSVDREGNTCWYNYKSKDTKFIGNLLSI